MFRQLSAVSWLQGRGEQIDTAMYWPKQVIKQTLYASWEGEREKEKDGERGKKGEERRGKKGEGSSSNSGVLDVCWPIDLDYLRKTIKNNKSSNLNHLNKSQIPFTNLWQMRRRKVIHKLHFIIFSAKHSLSLLIIFSSSVCSPMVWNLKVFRHCANAFCTLENSERRERGSEGRNKGIGREGGKRG